MLNIILEAKFSCWFFSDVISDWAVESILMDSLLFYLAFEGLKVHGTFVGTCYGKYEICTHSMSHGTLSSCVFCKIDRDTCFCEGSNRCRRASAWTCIRSSDLILQTVTDTLSTCLSGNLGGLAESDVEFQHGNLDIIRQEFKMMKEAIHLFP